MYNVGSKHDALGTSPAPRVCLPLAEPTYNQARLEGKHAVHLHGRSDTDKKQAYYA